MRTKTNTYLYSVTFTVSDTTNRVWDVCDTLNKALDVLRTKPEHGILTIHTVHQTWGRWNGTVSEYKSYAYDIFGKLKTLNNLTSVMGNNYSSTKYSAKIAR